MKFFFSQRFPRKPNPFARSPSYLLSQLISKLSNPQRRHRGHPRLSIVVTSPFRFTAVLKHRSWNTVKRSWWGKILASGPVSPSCTLVIRRRGIGRESRGWYHPFPLFLLWDENRLRRAILHAIRNSDHFAFIFFPLSLSFSLLVHAILFHGVCESSVTD